MRAKRFLEIIAAIFLLLIIWAVKGRSIENEPITTPSPAVEESILDSKKKLHEYIELTDSCGARFEGGCLRIRSGPGMEYPVVMNIREGAVLKVGEKVERGEHVWHKIVFDEWLRHPDRVEGAWYVAGDFTRVILDEGELHLTAKIAGNPNTKRIIVDRSKQMLYAYNGDELFMEEPISTGLEMTPTPRGSFKIFRKTPSRYMQGPIPGITEKEYDLPGVPWNLYFTYQGAVIHGTYWHENFGKQSSNGCVNLIPSEARKLYEWAEIGTRVIVRD